MKQPSPNLDSIFSALANEHRREFVHALSLNPHSISKLAAMRDMSLPAIHKHIAVLEKANLIQRKKVGRTSFLALKRSSLFALHNWLMQYHPYWGHDDETLANYEAYVRGGE